MLNSVYELLEYRFHNAHEKILPQKFKENNTAKNILSFVFSVCWSLVLVILTVFVFLLMFFAIDYIYLDYQINLEFIYIFMLVCAISALCSRKFLRTTKTSDYAINSKKMQAKTYAIANMQIRLINVFVAYAFFGFLGFSFAGFNLAEAIAVPIFIISIKIIQFYIELKNNKTQKSVIIRKIAIAIAIVFLAIFANIMQINNYYFSSILFYIITIALCVCAILALKFITNYDGFDRFYK